MMIYHQVSAGTFATSEISGSYILSISEEGIPIRIVFDQQTYPNRNGRDLAAFGFRDVPHTVEPSPCTPLLSHDEIVLFFFPLISF
jgi:hypothetical protein